jgi:outer membrane protein assembly factor BamB
MEEEAVWPVFRYDRQNTGRCPLRATYHGDHPWVFQTGKGIFSTPVIDHDGTVYIGSADHRFYALLPDGSLKWSFETGEIIDSAAVLSVVKAGEESIIIVPSGDGYLYCLRCESGDVIWKFDARITHRSGYNNWWEANIAIGEDDVNRIHYFKEH